MELFKVANEIVWSILSFISLHIVTENDTLLLKDFCLAETEFALSLVKEEGEESFFVGFINHTITEHSLVFMDPKFDDTKLIIAGFWVDSAYTLEDFTHITKIESVMYLAWGWLETLLDLVVDELGGVDNFVHKLEDFSVARLQEAGENLAEDHLN